MQSNTAAENHALRIEAQPIGLFETPIAYGRLKDADAVMRELEEDSGDAGGNFYLEDPRFSMAAMRNTTFRIRGVDGQRQQYQTEIQLQRGNLILFPAWLRHGVQTYIGNGERITIAMNMDAVSKDVNL